MNRLWPRRTLLAHCDSQNDGQRQRDSDDKVIKSRIANDAYARVKSHHCRRERQDRKRDRNAHDGRPWSMATGSHCESFSFPRGRGAKTETDFAFVKVVNTAVTQTTTKHSR